MSPLFLNFNLIGSSALSTSSTFSCPGGIRNIVPIFDRTDWHSFVSISNKAAKGTARPGRGYRQRLKLGDVVNSAHR